MKSLLAILLISLSPCLAFSQAIERSIQGEAGELALNGGMRLEELVSKLGAYAEMRNGDLARPQYIWKDQGKDDLSVFLEKGRLQILILRSGKFAYKSLRVGDSLEAVKKSLGEPSSMASEGAALTLVYKDEGLRVDVLNRTGLVYGIFLYFFPPTE